MKPTPLQIVNERFGGRAELAKQLASLVDKHHGDETEAEVRSRLMGLSNPKLLRLFTVEQKVRERYGDKDKLVDHIVATRQAAGHTADDAYRAKISAFTKAKLLDMTRQKYGPKPEKLSPEEKQAKKRGRKARKSA